MARVCFVCISMRGGGTERVVARLANAFCEKHQVHIVIVHPAESFYTLDERIKLHGLPGSQKSKPKLLRAAAMLRHIRRMFRQIQPDIILSFGELISPLARLASIGSGAGFIIFNRESPLRSLRGRAGIINPLVYPLADMVVTQTHQAKDLLKGRYRFSRFQVIPNPIEVPSSVVPIEERPNTVISVGHLGGEKNQQSLLQAFAASDHRHIWTLQIVGDGPDRSRLIKLANSLNISDRVEFMGERKDVPELLSSARIFAFSSLSEGFPNALSEALSHGCACISYDCITGPSELIQHEVNGLLIQTGNQELFTAELNRLMVDTSLQNRLSMAAQQDMKRFSAKRVLKDFERLVQRTAPQMAKWHSSPCD